MNQKFKSIATYIGVNGTYAALAYYGIMVGVPWCANFFMFASWLSLVLGLFSLGCMFLVRTVIDNGSMEYDKQKKFLESVGPKFMMPMWIDYIYDVCILGFLIYSGWIGYALIYLACCVSTNLSKRLIKECVQLAGQNVLEHETRVNRIDEEYLDEQSSLWDTETETNGSDDELFRMGVITREREE